MHPGAPSAGPSGKHRGGASVQAEPCPLTGVVNPEPQSVAVCGAGALIQLK